MSATNQAAYRRIGSLFFLLFLVGCAATPQTDQLLDAIPPDLLKPVDLISVPFYPQKEYQCGPAALATILDYRDKEVQLEKLTRRIYIPARKGSLQIELVAAIRDAELIPYVIYEDIPSLLRHVQSGQPVLVLQNLGVSWYPKWHYAVVVGFDLNNSEIILRSGTTKRYVMNLNTFEHTWRRSRFWGVVALKPDELPAVVTSDAPKRYFQAIAGFEQTRKWELLDQAYRTALDHWPGQLELSMGFANNLYQRDQKLQALVEYEKVITRHQKYAPAYNNAAQVYAEQGKFDKAISYVNTAIKLGGVHLEQFKSTLNDIIKMQKQQE